MFASLKEIGGTSQFNFFFLGIIRRTYMNEYNKIVSSNTWRFDALYVYINKDEIKSKQVVLSVILNI